MTSIFLSLSFVDAKFVEAVHERLPRGVARYFQRSFDRGEDLIEAMEKGLQETEIFVLFATSAALKSFAVSFEIEEARRRSIFGHIKRVFVFPTESGLDFTELPQWMQNAWSPNYGETPSDIARFLTTVLLEPDRGLSIAAPNVVGRGSTMDAVRRLAASHLQQRREMPRVYIFAGVTGVGRRTFAAYYLRNGLSADAALPYGPTVTLSAQAELVDLYRSIRIEVDPLLSTDKVIADQEAFNRLSEDEQIAEVVRTMGHFARLRQAVTIISAAGFFEDAATPKGWVKSFFRAIPKEQILVVVTNLQFRFEFVDDVGVAVQQRVAELADEDTRALMIFTANLLNVENFKISDKLVASIGGHPDIANAAVRLAKQKGVGILERDPRQLFNIQRSIIGDIVRPENLSEQERFILDILGWLPSLGSDLLEKIVVGELKVSLETFNDAIEKLILSCLIYPSGYKIAIASSVRQLYRRYNVTAPSTLEAMSRLFEREWRSSKNQSFRDDLFSAFVFMHLLEGKSLPAELRRLLTASNLYEVVRDVYARGKTTEDIKIIEQAVEWGKLAFEMPMAEGLREEILSTVARAQIRLEKYKDAEDTIDFMRSRHYRATVFLEGHLLRKQRRFEDAIPKLRFVLAHNRGNRAAVHELALCYRRLRRTKDLEALLRDHRDAVDDSAEFLNFAIALQISRGGDLSDVPHAIEQLRQIDETSNRADQRQAQYLSKRFNDATAFKYLTDVISNNPRASIRLRAARAIYAARSNNLKEARNDLLMIKSVQKNEARSANIEVQILLGEGRAKDAYDLSMTIEPQEPGDWLLRATVLEAFANDPTTGLSIAQSAKRDAQAIRARFAGESDFLFED